MYSTLPISQCGPIHMSLYFMIFRTNNILFLCTSFFVIIISENFTNRITQRNSTFNPTLYETSRFKNILEPDVPINFSSCPRRESTSVGRIGPVFSFPTGAASQLELLHCLQAAEII